MTKKLERRRVPHRPAECRELALVRLANNWTFDELAAQMKAAHVAIPMRTLHYLLTRTDVRPHDRTLHKLRQFLDHLHKRSARRKEPRHESRVAHQSVSDLR